MSHANADLITRAYELFGQADMENLQKLWADDIVWHIAGDSRISGNHASAAGILTMFGQLLEATAGTFKVELQSAMADDEAGFSLHKATAHKAGESYELWNVLSYRFVNGLIDEIWTYPFDQAAEEQLFA